MAKIIALKNADGSRSFGTSVSVKPFKRRWQSFATKAEAVKWRDDLTAELRKQKTAGASRPDIATLTLAAVNGAYLTDPETTRLGDFKDRKRHLTWWTLHYGTVKALEFGVEKIREGRNALFADREPATVDRYLASQRRAWNWARNAGFGLTSHAWPTDIMLTEPDARVRYLSDDELIAVQNAAKAHSPLMFAALTLALATGARSGEMFRLTWGDVDVARSTVRFLKTKNGSPRSVHLPQVALEALTAIRPATNVPTQHVFVDGDGKWMSGQRIDRQWRKIRSAANLVDFRWHDLRHSCASFLAQSGATLVEIGSVLGHKSAAVTMKYAHLVAGKAVTGHAALDAKLRASSAS
jgi:integrase